MIAHGEKAAPCSDDRVQNCAAFPQKKPLVSTSSVAKEFFIFLQKALEACKQVRQNAKCAGLLSRWTSWALSPTAGFVAVRPIARNHNYGYVDNFRNRTGSYGHRFSAGVRAQVQAE
jgi:hypothetical protein